MPTRWERAPVPDHAGSGVRGSPGASGSRLAAGGEERFKVRFVAFAGALKHCSEGVALQPRGSPLVPQQVLGQALCHVRQPGETLSPCFLHRGPWPGTTARKDSRVAGLRIGVGLGVFDIHPSWERGFLTGAGCLRPCQRDSLPCRQVRDDVLDRPVGTREGGAELWFGQAGQQIFPTHERLSHRCHELLLGVRGRAPWRFVCRSRGECARSALGPCRLTRG
jgi:hypothetical protein